MRKKKFTAKLLAAIVAAALSFAMLAGCGKETYRLKYYDETDPERGYNENLFYLNDMPAECADPTCIYIDDESDPDYGWFYMYPTSDSDFGCHGFSAYKSRDLKSWQYVGPVFDPKEESWSHFSCWAPECIYDAETGKYYLFYSSTDYYNALSTPGRANNDGLSITMRKNITAVLKRILTQSSEITRKRPRKKLTFLTLQSTN